MTEIEQARIAIAALKGQRDSALDALVDMTVQAEVALAKVRELEGKVAELAPKEPTPDA